MNIERHPAPDSSGLADLVAFYDSTIQSNLPRWRQDGSGLPDMLDAYLDCAVARSAEDAADSFIAAAVQRIAQVAALAFALATETEGTESGTVGDEVWTLERRGPQSLVNLTRWLPGLCCAVASGESELVERLSDTALVRAAFSAPGISSAPYGLPYRLTYAAWATRADDAPELLDLTRSKLPDREKTRKSTC